MPPSDLCDKQACGLKLTHQLRTDRPHSRTLHWSAIQPMVTTAEPDVLLMLDCCYASTAAFSSSACGSKEVLAACSSESVSTGLANNCWTRSLVDELKRGARCGEGVTAYQLQDRLLTRRRWELVHSSQYHVLSPHEQPRMKLYPMDANRMLLFTHASPPTSDEIDMQSYDRIKMVIHLRESVLPFTANAWGHELLEELPTTRREEA